MKKNVNLGQCRPPGAVGGQYGSGCFHFSNNFSVSFSSACTIPPGQRFLSCVQPQDTVDISHPLQTWIGNIAVLLEEGADVKRLAPPEVAMHRPVESELQCPAVERAGAIVSATRFGLSMDANMEAGGIKTEGVGMTDRAACLFDMVGGCGDVTVLRFRRLVTTSTNRDPPEPLYVSAGKPGYRVAAPTDRSRGRGGDIPRLRVCDSRAW